MLLHSYNFMFCRFPKAFFPHALDVLGSFFCWHYNGSFSTWTLYSRCYYCILCHHSFILDISYSCQQHSIKSKFSCSLIGFACSCMVDLIFNYFVFQKSGPNNFIAREWWFIMFQYFEKNIGGPVPRLYDWPLPWPRRWHSKSRDS